MTDDLETELEADETRGSGCGFDANLVWSIDDIGCQSGSHVVVGGRSTLNVDQSSTCQMDAVGAAVRCCADAVVGPTTCQYNRPDDDTVTVYIINAQNQCGESTIPSDWAQLGLDWISSQVRGNRIGHARNNM